MFGLRLFPQRKVYLVFLFAHTVEFTAGIVYILQVTARQNAVAVRFVVFHHIEIHRTVRFVCKSVIHDLLHEFFLFDDMSRSMRFDAGRQHIQFLHSLVEAVRIVLSHFHRFQLFQTRFFGNFVFAFVCIMFQVAHIGNVAHVAHLVAQMFQVAEYEVERNGRACMTQMAVAIHRRSANIHANMSRMNGHEAFFATRQRVIQK